MCFFRCFFVEHYQKLDVFLMVLHELFSTPLVHKCAIHIIETGPDVLALFKNIAIEVFDSLLGYSSFTASYSELSYELN